MRLQGSERHCQVVHCRLSEMVPARHATRDQHVICWSPEHNSSIQAEHRAAPSVSTRLHASCGTLQHVEDSLSVVRGDAHLPACSRVRGKDCGLGPTASRIWGGSWKASSCPGDEDLPKKGLRAGAVPPDSACRITSEMRARSCNGCGPASACAQHDRLEAGTGCSPVMQEQACALLCTLH